MAKVGSKVKYLSPTEIISTISHSKAPSIVTEGDDDVIVWRRLEERFPDVGLTLIPAGGREAVLEVYRRRGELKPTSIAMFIADRDIWAISGVPVHYHGDGLFFTSGYSVENDMFADGQLDNLLTLKEKQYFLLELYVTVQWFALACSRSLGGADDKLDIHPNELLDDASRRIALTTLRHGEVYPESLRIHIQSNFSLLLRGKTLFSLLLRHTKGCSHRVLLNVGASRGGQLFLRIEESVRGHLAHRTPSSALTP